MNKILIITGIAAVMISSCGGPRRDEGRIYMPDMTYSRAYETYAPTQNLKDKGINYTAMPVLGTIARGDSAPYLLPNTDSGYAGARSVTNPITSMAPKQMMEAERLYLVNCAICHATDLQGNGPLYKDGTGPYPTMPRNLLDPYSKALSEGQMFHVVTHGKGMMGSYASQLNPNQRWMVVAYVRSKQAGSATGKDSAAAKTTNTQTGAATDTTRN